MFKKFKIILTTLVFLYTYQLNVSASTLYLHQDHQGSTVLVTDENGSVVGKKGYYPYGEVSDETGDTDVERLYTSQVSDADQTGLYYYNQRYYNPTLSKFIQPDPIKDGLNGYAYVSNNPINKVDPSGLMDYEGDDGGIGGGIGGVPCVNCHDSPSTAIPTTNSNECMFGCHNLSEQEFIAGEPMNEAQETVLKTLTMLTQIVVTGGLASVGGLTNATQQLFTQCLLSSRCLAGLALLDIVDTTVDTVSCISGNSDSCAYILNPIPGAGLADDLQIFIDEGASLIKAGKYAEAYKHFENIDAALRFGLDLDPVGGNSLPLPLNTSNAEEIKDAFKIYGRLSLGNYNAGEINLGGYVGSSTDFVQKENALFALEEWHHALQDIRGINRASWEIDVAQYLRDFGIELNGTRWIHNYPERLDVLNK